MVNEARWLYGLIRSELRDWWRVTGRWLLLGLVSLMVLSFGFGFFFHRLIRADPTSDAIRQLAPISWILNWAIETGMLVLWFIAACVVSSLAARQAPDARGGRIILALSQGAPVLLANFVYQAAGSITQRLSSPSLFEAMPWSFSLGLHAVFSDVPKLALLMLWPLALVVLGRPVLGAIWLALPALAGLARIALPFGQYEAYSSQYAGYLFWAVGLALGLVLLNTLRYGPKPLGLAAWGVVIASMLGLMVLRYFEATGVLAQLQALWAMASSMREFPQINWTPILAPLLSWTEVLSGAWRHIISSLVIFALRLVWIITVLQLIYVAALMPDRQRKRADSGLDAVV